MGAMSWIREKLLKRNQENENMMSVHVTTFVKKNGDTRFIRYLTLEEMDEKGLWAGSAKSDGRKMQPGHVLVWDFDNNGIRTLNQNTIQGGVFEEQIDITDFKKQFGG